MQPSRLQAVYRRRALHSHFRPNSHFGISLHTLVPSYPDRPYKDAVLTAKETGCILWHAQAGADIDGPTSLLQLLRDRSVADSALQRRADRPCQVGGRRDADRDLHARRGDGVQASPPSGAGRCRLLRRGMRMLFQGASCETSLGNMSCPGCRSIDFTVSVATSKLAAVMANNSWHAGPGSTVRTKAFSNGLFLRCRHSPVRCQC